MSLILNIDTAVDAASVCLEKDDKVLQLFINENQKDHASWLHPSIAEMLHNNRFTMKDIDAIAVSIGPGSYTGLRVGLSTAKGLCYAMNIPLITISTLEMMAIAVKNEADDLICPLIDARRMEVFTAIYDKMLQQLVAPQTMIIDENSFAKLLFSNKILFCGNGCKKLQKIISSPNATFSSTVGNASHLASLSHNRFRKKEFADLAYIEPLYLKEFYSPVRKPQS
jgi:tRNA threonylcarbamoyladenosine biosynthesis protein TsaB